METQKSQFNRILMIILIALFLVSLGLFGYASIAVDPGAVEWWMLLLNLLILSIPLALLYGSIYVLVVAWRAHASGNEIGTRLAKVIHWAPRIAAILIIFFISLFSLDVFEEGAAPLEMLGALVMHNIPSIVLIVLLIIAWKRPAVGFVAFLAGAVLFAGLTIRSIFSLSNLVLFVLPLLLIAMLFYAEWKWLKPQPPAAAEASVQP